MKKIAIATFVSCLTVGGGAQAADMFLDLGSNAPDLARAIGAPDLDSRTGVFSEFGFSQLLATSVYDFSDGTALGAFYDTNLPVDLAFAGIPTAGLALDGATPVNLVSPNCPAGQCDIDALSPLVPPLGSDNEGFLQTWDLQVEYRFDGTLTAGGPVYTSGTFNVFYNDLAGVALDRLVLTGSLTGSDIQAANLNLFFDITFAEAGFLWIDSGSGFIDAASAITPTSKPRLVLDTNVNPPIPTADQLLLVVDGGGNPNAIRQTTLDGSVTGQIPEPGTLALLGLGLLGLGGALRRKA